jgi:hypothetical protein
MLTFKNRVARTHTFRSKTGELWILTTECIHALRIVVTLNRDYLYKQQLDTDVWNGETPFSVTQQLYFLYTLYVSFGV